MGVVVGVVVGGEVGVVVVGGFVGLGGVTAGGWFGTVKETGQVLVLRKPGTTGQGEAAVKAKRGHNNAQCCIEIK